MVQDDQRLLMHIGYLDGGEWNQIQIIFNACECTGWEGKTRTHEDGHRL